MFSWPCGQRWGWYGSETTYWPDTPKNKNFSDARERFSRAGEREHKESRALRSPGTKKEHALSLSTFIHSLTSLTSVYTMHCSKSCEQIHKDRSEAHPSLRKGEFRNLVFLLALGLHLFVSRVDGHLGGRISGLSTGGRAEISTTLLAWAFD